MEQGFIDILKQLVKEHSAAALTDVAKCRTLLPDYTKNQYKTESRLLMQAVEAGVPKTIAGAENLVSCKKAQIKELENDYSLSPVLAMDIVNALALVLRGDTTKTEIEIPAAAPTPVKGKLELPEGAVYEGNLIDGVPNGKGKVTKADGLVVYEGDWADANMHGAGLKQQKKRRRIMKSMIC